jgi:enhancing lycopene biosynthesis protein 2
MSEINGEKKTALVILSGCGFLDGAEIHESVLTLLALSRAGVNVTVAAPDKAQHHVVDHGSGQEVAGESRNVLTETNRIARGGVMALGKGSVTIGNDAGTAGAIAALGGNHIDCAVDETTIDGENKIVTAPAYMYDAPIHEVAAGIDKAVGAFVEML